MSFFYLPFDAGTLLRLLYAQISVVFEHSPQHYLATFSIENIQVNILYDKNDFPYFRIYENDTLQGFAKLLEDGVGRIKVFTQTSTDFIKCLEKLTKPCICRAGHLFVCLLRSCPLHCNCKSLLDTIETSFKKTGSCPIKHLKESFLSTQESAIQYAHINNAQRCRLRNSISSSR